MQVHKNNTRQTPSVRKAMPTPEQMRIEGQVNSIADLAERLIDHLQGRQAVDNGIDAVMTWLENAADPQQHDLVRIAALRVGVQGVMATLAFAIKAQELDVANGRAMEAQQTEPALTETFMARTKTRIVESLQTLRSVFTNAMPESRAFTQDNYLQRIERNAHILRGTFPMGENILDELVSIVEGKGEASIAVRKAAYETFLTTRSSFVAIRGADFISNALLDRAAPFAKEFPQARAMQDQLNLNAA